MGVLDDFLLGRGGNRRGVDNSIFRDYINRKVTNITDKGLSFEQFDNRASTLGAATALQATTGSIPEGFFSRISPNAPNTDGSSILAFPEAQREEVFKRLGDVGAGPGTSVNELQEIFAQQGNQQLQSLLEGMLAGQSGPQSRSNGGSRQPFGSTDSGGPGSSTGGSRASGNGFANIVESFLKSYKPNSQGGLPANNNDPSALGNFLKRPSAHQQGGMNLRGGIFDNII